MKKIRLPKLGIFYPYIYHIKLNKKQNDNNGNGSNDVDIYKKTTKDMLVDSLLVGAIVFIASLPSTGIPSLDNLYSAIRGFFYYFLAQLIVDRVTGSIVKQVKKPKGGK